MFRFKNLETQDMKNQERTFMTCFYHIGREFKAI